MKFYADDQLIFEVPDHMIDVLSQYENREEAEVRFQHVVSRILEAHCISFMKRFRKDWEAKVPGQPKSDKEFVESAKSVDGYKEYKEKMLEATKKAKEKSEKKRSENEAKKAERKEALRKEREEKGALS